MEAEILGWAFPDSQPLYAVGWPPEAERPTDPADRQLQDAQQAAIRLIGDGLLEVTKAEPFDEGTTRVGVHVDPELWEGILSDARNWGSGNPDLDARQPGPRFEVGATEAGMRAWRSYAKQNALIGFIKFDRSAKRVPKQPPQRR